MASLLGMSRVLNRTPILFVEDKNYEGMWKSTKEAIPGLIEKFQIVHGKVSMPACPCLLACVPTSCLPAYLSIYQFLHKYLRACACFPPDVYLPIYSFSATHLPCAYSVTCLHHYIKTFSYAPTSYLSQACLTVPVLPS